MAATSDSIFAWADSVRELFGIPGKTPITEGNERYLVFAQDSVSTSVAAAFGWQYDQPVVVVHTSGTAWRSDLGAKARDFNHFIFSRRTGQLLEVSKCSDLNAIRISEMRSGPLIANVDPSLPSVRLHSIAGSELEGSSSVDGQDHQVEVA